MKDKYENEDGCSVGCIGNYYGDLSVKKKDGSYYWSIENYNGHNWEQIPEYLFEALKRFNDEVSGESP